MLPRPCLTIRGSLEGRIFGIAGMTKPFDRLLQYARLVESQQIMKKYRGCASLRKANLQGANLEDANLSEANLKGVNFSGANLKNADLSEADLYRANFSGADLTGADLTEALIDSADFSGAVGVSLDNAIQAD